METIWREEGNSESGTIADRISRLEREVSLKEARAINSEEKQKKFRWTGKFRSVFSKNPKDLYDKIIVLPLNSKREIEEPIVLPIISGGIIVYKDKGYKFDPTALYTIKIKNKINKVLILEEDDRLPHGSKYKQVKPTDVEQLKSNGRYPRNDPILLKMLWNAQIERKPKLSGSMGWILWVALGIAAIVVIYMFMK
jgi:hypothetical protein